MQVASEFHFVPGFVAALERSPDAVQARDRLARQGSGRLPARARAMIGLTIAHETGFDYCIWAQTRVARAAGLSGEDILFAAAGTALDRREAAITLLARSIVRSGAFSERDVRSLPQHPLLTREEMLEVAACVGAAVIDNYILQSVAPDDAHAIAPSAR